MKKQRLVLGFFLVMLIYASVEKQPILGVFLVSVMLYGLLSFADRVRHAFIDLGRCRVADG